MENIKIILGKWDKLIQKYDRDSKKLQQQIADIIKIQWTASNTRSESEMKKIIEKSGIL